MSNIHCKNPTPVIDFREKRREYVIRRMIRSQEWPPEEIAQMLQMHEFLLHINKAKNLPEEIDQEILIDFAEDIKVIEEKFDELFEIVK
jgi:hypothetical protein